MTLTTLFSTVQPPPGTSTMLLCIPRSLKVPLGPAVVTLARSLPALFEGEAMALPHAAASSSESNLFSTMLRLFSLPLLLPKLRKPLLLSRFRAEALEERTASAFFLLGESGMGCGGSTVVTAHSRRSFPEIRSARFCMSLAASERQWSICTTSSKSSTAARKTSAVRPKPSPRASVSAIQICGRMMRFLMTDISSTVCLMATAMRVTFCTYAFIVFLIR
mmetsp:Transcript_96829/g.216965  ORF Transcript_96829/g.216965 Transcript_96829/m.216965 type:complete len:220 (+) Transcript_96829:151-810(+)